MATTRVASLLAWTTLLAALPACDLTSVQEIEPEDVIVAEAYLRPGDPRGMGHQEVFLYRTLPGVDGTLRVDGATVELATPNPRGGEWRARLQETAADRACAVSDVIQDGTGGTCYRGLFAASPGGTYTLEITTGDGRRLTGTTTMPEAFEILQPAADSCAAGDDGFEVVWSRSEGAWSYQIVARFTGLAEGLAARGVEDPPDELELTGLAIGAADTTIVFPGEFGVFDRFSVDRDVLLALQQGLPSGAAADIVVAAGDENFVNWVRGGNFNPSGQVRVPSITGDGTGVFASLATRRFTVLSQTPGYPACP